MGSGNTALIKAVFKVGGAVPRPIVLHPTILGLEPAAVHAVFTGSFRRCIEVFLAHRSILPTAALLAQHKAFNIPPGPYTNRLRRETLLRNGRDN
jgi:hypothetical protein